MADPILSVGTTISVVKATPATYDAAGFGALTFVAIGEVESLGEFGGKTQLTNFIPLNSGIVKKLKGSTDYGTASMVIGLLDNDAGQVIIKEGFDGAGQYNIHSFKVVASDGSVTFFTAYVTSFVITTGGANDVRKASCELALNNKVVSDLFS